MTAYETNLQRIAEKLVKKAHPHIGNLSKHARDSIMMDMCDLAAICLEEMANQYEQGYSAGYDNSYIAHVEKKEYTLITLDNLGLVPDKNEG